MSSSNEFGQQLVNKHQFSSSLDHSLELKIWCIGIVNFPKAIQNLFFSTYEKEYRDDISQGDPMQLEHYS